MAADGPIWAMGLMSGTSMDGVDAALLLTDGEAISGFGPALGVSPAYGAAEQRRMAEATEAARAEIVDGATGDAHLLAQAALAADRIHAAAALSLAPRLDAEIGVAGYHGQTVFHAPERGRTVQLGDGAWLARVTGLPVVWDFRSADMEAGGQGAPLAPFYHWALARWIGAEGPLAFLNIGGVANVTWVDPAAAAPELPGALMAFDTGPGNGLIDDWVRRTTGASHDEGGALAARGRVRRDLLASSAAAAFLAKPGPKSLDRNDFAPILRAMAGLSAPDGAATLTAFTVECVAASLHHLPTAPERWLVCGGGRLNVTMMQGLADRLGAPVDPVEAVGLDGDMLEAQAFAYLAVRVLRGLPTSAPGTTGCRAPVSGGRITYP